MFFEVERMGRVFMERKLCKWGLEIGKLYCLLEEIEGFWEGKVDKVVENVWNLISKVFCVGLRFLDYVLK